MKKSDFQALLVTQLGILQALTATKGEEYARSDDDQCANLKRSAAEAGISSMQAWLVFFNKHADAIKSFIKTGIYHSEPIEGRIDDAILYLILLKAMVIDREEELGRLAGQLQEAATGMPVELIRERVGLPSIMPGPDQIMAAVQTIGHNEERLRHEIAPVIEVRGGSPETAAAWAGFVTASIEHAAANQTADEPKPNAADSSEPSLDFGDLNKWDDVKVVRFMDTPEGSRTQAEQTKEFYTLWGLAGNMHGYEKSIWRDRAERLRKQGIIS